MPCIAVFKYAAEGPHALQSACRRATSWGAAACAHWTVHTVVSAFSPEFSHSQVHAKHSMTLQHHGPSHVPRMLHRQGPRLLSNGEACNPPGTQAEAPRVVKFTRPSP